jgi:hypothetical protein
MYADVYASIMGQEHDVVHTDVYIHARVHTDVYIAYGCIHCIRMYTYMQCAYRCIHAYTLTMHVYMHNMRATYPAPNTHTHVCAYIHTYTHVCVHLFLKMRPTHANIQCLSYSKKSHT